MPVKYLYFLLFLVSSINGLTYQNSISNNQSPTDCENAIIIDQFNPVSVQFLGMAGQQDVLGDYLESENEVNSVWLRIAPKLQGEFDLTFTPNNNIDFQVYVFKDSSNEFCSSDVKENIVFKATKLKTESSRSINFKAQTKFDDVFYVLLHSRDVHKNTVDLTFNLVGDRLKEDVVVQNFKSNYLRNEVRIAIRDSISDDPIVANMTISNLGYDGNLFQGSDFVFDATNKGESEVFLNAKGYFIYSNKLNFNTGKDVYQKIKLVPLSTGLKLQMEGILFVQDSKEFLPSSQAALQRLLEFMVMNSDVKIEIRGHINAPGKKMNGKIKRLSKARAKNTYKYLVKNGISKDRISYKGMGNSEMLYPNPENNSEEQANRRVEILIL